MRKAASLFILAGSLVAQGPRMNRGFGPPAMRGGPGGSPAVVTGAPFSAIETTMTQQVLTGGNVIQRQEQATVYRDSQGRVRTESVLKRPDGSSSTRISVNDPVAGVRRMIDPQKQTVVEQALPSSGGPARGARQQQNHTGTSDPNLLSENLGTQMVNGITANGTRLTRTIPAGAIGNANPIQIVQETWTSPDLQEVVLVKTTDPRRGVTVRQMTNINRQEPDAALFQAPAGYQIRQQPAGRPPFANAQPQ